MSFSNVNRVDGVIWSTERHSMALSLIDWIVPIEASNVFLEVMWVPLEELKRFDRPPSYRTEKDLCVVRACTCEICTRGNDE